jgi:5-methylcytosine-specific restriction endonuclease McrA
VSDNPRYRNYSARVKLRNRLKAEGRPCALCGQPIDYTLPARHPMSFVMDEIVPVSKGGSPIDYDNVQAAHRVCNERKGNGERKGTKVAPLPHSRNWRLAD